MAVVAGERRIVTVLFADIVGSTGISERLGAERFTLLVDEVMHVMSAEVESFDGTVVQYVGDELYAVFGAPVAHEDDSERAVRAGLAIQQTLGQYATDVKAAYGVDLAVRIAINTGPVVIRPESDDPYNALGETVNVAARIQKLVSGGEIVIGRATKAQVESCVLLEDLGLTELRGVAEPVRPFRVLGLREGGTGRPTTSLVGRDFELAVLDRVLDDLVDGRGSIVSIIGEPGIGKSRLIAEVASRFDEHVRFIEGRAVSYAQSFPYYSVRDLLREWLGVGGDTPEARTRLELKAELARLFGDDADAAYPFLGSLLGLKLEPDAGERLRETSREAVQRQTFEFFAELCGRLSLDRPLCLVLDDLHWADDSTLELIEELLPSTEEAALCLVLLYRSERDHGSWRLGERARQRHPHRYREIELRPLPDDASRALASIVAGAELPESVSEVLAVRAGGNPFFLEEALLDLLERGALQRENGKLVLAVDFDKLAVPTIVQAALQARLDRLDPATREVLSYAAVIGRSFGLPLLEQIVPREQAIPALSELQRLDLVIEERRRPAPEYRFRHGLVQEVAYGTLLNGKRRKMHRAVGEAIEQDSRDAPERAYSVLARHFSEADEPEKAADYLLMAGDAARALHADQVALGHYSRARVFLARIGDDRRTRETLFKMALAYHLAFDFERAEEVLDEAFCCRVEEEPHLVPTERLETSFHRPSTLSPGHVYSTDEMQIAEHLFRGLLTVDEEMNVLPDLADNYRVSADGRTYLFRLGEGLRWSDGVPLTADDFVYALRRIREDGLKMAAMIADVESAEALDDRTLEIRLLEPRSYFPYVLASAWAFPWPRHHCEALGDAWHHPANLVGNGPFVLKEHTDEGLVLVSNPLWTGPRGNVREVAVKFRVMGPATLDEWRDGRYDILQAYDRSMVDAPDTRAEVVSQLSVHYAAFRADRQPFSSQLVRKAFAHAIDRSRLAGMFGDLALLAVRGGAIPPAMPGHSHRVGPEYDPELAARLLAEAGYPEGKGLPVLGLAAPKWIAGAQELISQWEAIGARIELTRLPVPLDFDSLGEHDILISAWGADYPDPDGFFRGFVTSGPWPVYMDDEIDELLERARSLHNQAERMRLYHEIDRLWVHEHAAVLPLMYPRMMLLSRPWVAGYPANPLHKARFDQVVITRGSAVPLPDQAEAFER